MPWTDDLTASEKASLRRAEQRRQEARARYAELRIILKNQAEGRMRAEPGSPDGVGSNWTDRLTPSEATSLADSGERRRIAREAYNTLRARLKSRAEARIRRRTLKSVGVTRSVRWTAFESRAPSEAERRSDRIIGYFPLTDGSGNISSPWYGKLVFDDDEQAWRAESYPEDNGIPERSPIKKGTAMPTHWALVPKLP